MTSTSLKVNSRAAQRSAASGGRRSSLKRSDSLAEDREIQDETAPRLVLPEGYRLSPVDWWKRFLVNSEGPIKPEKASSQVVRILDMFSSVGGLALGAVTASTMLGRKSVIEGAIDTDIDALRVHEFNLKTRRVIHESVLDVVDLSISKDRKSGRLRLTDPVMLPLGEGFESVNLLIGGPPCQGHSTLNNKTRSDDPKNKLMLAMPAVAVALGIESVVIENVPNVVNDHGGVVDKTVELLESHGYFVERGIVSARDLGWPQTRKRFFLVARLNTPPLPLASAVNAIAMEPQNISWIIEDLLNESPKQGIMSSTPKLSAENEERIAWLFRNRKFDLENHMRPDCHKDGHTYPSVYGRMRWNEPAPTITGGFQTPGRGRFIHPKRKRVLTPHEAARIQGFPDWFDFETPSGDALTRTMLGKWIGDAVPSIMASAAVISAIS